MRITIFVPEDVHLLEIAGLRDALFEANRRISPGEPYHVRLVSEDGAPARSASGVKFLPDAGMADVSDPCDTLVVVGSFGVPDRPSEAVKLWLRQQAAQARRYGSICTGAFILAEAGLLAGRCVTTHWQFADRLAAEFADIDVEPDRIFVRDGPVFSSAGVAAAIDLAFSLIEEDHGRALALWVARRLVVYLKRPGGQSQFSTVLTAQSGAGSPFDTIQVHILENPREDLSLAALAEVAGMSPRNLARLFRASLAMTPATYVELTRVDIARRLLEDSKSPIKVVAHAAGFGSMATLRRAFVRRLGITPTEYRARFHSAESGQAVREQSGTALS